MASAVACAAAMLAMPVAVPTALADGECQAGVKNYVMTRPWTSDLFELETLHERATGAGVTVAVVDSGVDDDNPHLKGALLEGASYVDLDKSHGMEDTYNHGTIIAGIIAARKVEGSAVEGLAPGVRIIPIRVFEALREEQGHTVGAPSMETVAEGVHLAVERGAKVINVSMSDTRDIPQMREAIEFAESHGALIVASAGNKLTASNTKDGTRYPAAYPQVLGVTAVDTSLAPTDDSVHGPQVDVAAPGMSVASTIPSGLDCVFSSDAASASYATAYASAQAALIAERYPDETPAQWRQRIKATANRVDPDRRTDEVGWGVIDPLSSLEVELGDGLRGPDLEGNASEQVAQTTQSKPVLLDPLVDGNAGMKLLASLMVIGTAVLCAVSWLLPHRRKRS
ncbi:S8 family serine peptidase [Bifidobacterium cuniculi]|nr:S8 family serine peptidase [Bifidobacterium cuniculi]